VSNTPSVNPIDVEKDLDFPSMTATDLLDISEGLLEAFTEMFKMLSDPSRLKIVLLLAQQGRMNVSDLKVLLAQTQPAVSHHLTLLRMAKLVRFQREGRHNYYYLDSKSLVAVFQQLFAETNNTSNKLEFADFCLTLTPPPPEPIVG
jgi:ArsR family transcriptional regulator